MDDENINQEPEEGKGLGEKAKDGAKDLANKGVDKLKEKGGEAAKEAIKKGTEKLAKEGAKTAAKTAATSSAGAAAGGAAGAAGLAAAAYPILIATAVIICIITIIGILMFFITMPGMVLEKLKQLGKAIARGLASWFGADTSEMVENEAIYSTLEYLDEMGYDLRGYGFLSQYIESEADLKGSESASNVAKYENGIAYDSDGKIYAARSEFVYTYLVSDNYLYTLANHNLVTQSSSTNWLEYLWNGIVAMTQHAKDFFFGSYSEKYTNGMLHVYEEGNKGLGSIGSLYSDTGFLNFDDMDIDPDAKTFKIKKGMFNNSMAYSLDGWVGRYGMPLDFLLSVHLSTMMPDLAMDMAGSFNTEIALVLHKVTGSRVDAAFETDQGEKIKYDVFEHYADSWVPLDAWRLSRAECVDLFAAYVDKGLVSPPNCTYVDSEIGFTSLETYGSYEWTQSDAVDARTTDLDETGHMEYKGEENIKNLYNNIIIPALQTYDMTYTEMAANNLPSSIVSVSEFTDIMRSYTIEESARKYCSDYSTNYSPTLLSPTTVIDEDYYTEVIDYFAWVEEQRTYDGNEDWVPLATYNDDGTIASIDDDFEYVGFKESGADEYGYYHAYRNPEMYYKATITWDLTEGNSQGKTLANPKTGENYKVVYNDYSADIYYSSVTAEFDINFYDYYKADSYNYCSLNDLWFQMKITAEWTEKSFEDLVASGYPIGNDKCSDHCKEGDSNKISKVCPNCRKYLQKIYDLLKKPHDNDFDYYIPYIARVKDHWYRDVYFAIDTTNSEFNGQGTDDIKFVKGDYDYEALTKERWTKYETDPTTGEYVYYKLDSNGKYTNQKYEPTTYDFIKLKYTKAELENMSDDELADLGISRSDINNIDFDNRVAFAKKAESFYGTSQSELEDLNWSKTTGGLWTAYDENYEKVTTEWVKLYPDDEDYVKQHIVTQMIDADLFKQVGDGIRTETNPKIKKMFLINKYFKYDGNVDTADVITALRDKYFWGKNSHDEDYLVYGAINEAKNGSTNLIDMTKLDEKGTSGYYVKKTDVNEKVYGTANLQGDDQYFYLKDYIGNVSINTQSLSAFSMLENENSLDAEFIYRDFKELIVELGYFTKEEMTDETPKLLGWVIPEIGSGGWPNRTLDKSQYVKGTMIHSKDDIITNLKNTMAALREAAGDPGDAYDPENNSDQASVGRINKPLIGGVGAIESKTTPFNYLVNVGAATNVPDTNYTFTASGDSGAAKITGTLEFDGVEYEVWAQTDSTCTLYSFAFLAQGYAEDPCETYLKTSSGAWVVGGAGTYNTYWGPLGVYWDPMLDVIPGTWYTDSTNAIENVSNSLAEGKPVYVYSGYSSSGGNHAVVLMGAGSGGKVIIYNPGAGTIDEYGSSSSFTSNITEFFTDGVNQSGGSLHRYLIPDEPPKGFKRRNTKAYDGYQGNEEVVSPVTGILLDYGVYDPSSSDPINHEGGDKNYPSRTNTDLRYPNINSEEAKGGDTTSSEAESTEQTENNGEEIPDVGAGGEIVSDKVGYAVIKLLTPEDYTKLESDLRSKTSKFTSANYVTDTGNFTEYTGTMDEDTVKDWKDADNLLYGYKEFAENYHDTGLAGNIIVIDGFLCEEKDEDYDPDDETADPSGDAITLSSFKKITSSSFDATTHDISDETAEELLANRMEKPEYYKFASKKATDKINAENIVKTNALGTYSVGNTIFIKEGTVLGRTMTDKELATEVRGWDESKLAEYRPDSGEALNEAGKVLGNYIRLTMTVPGETETVVEDIENYMNIDENSGARGIYGDLEAIDENSTDVEKVRAAMTYFIDEQGFTAEGAAGILGNLIQESALIPSIESDLGYRGLAQWSTTWFPQQVSWMSGEGYDENSFAGQIRSICEAPNQGSMSTHWDKLRETTNIDEATEYFAAYYEVCIYGQDAPSYVGTGELYQELDERKQFAKNAYDIYMGDDNKGIKDMD